MNLQMNLQMEFTGPYLIVRVRKSVVGHGGRRMASVGHGRPRMASVG